MSGNPFSIDIGADRAAIDAAIADVCSWLPRLPPPLPDAIRYAVRGPGKRLRGIIVCAAYRAAGGTADPAPLAAVVEIIHAYSLVHDDLPSMDDDDVRRGRPTLHRVYGTATATVVGVVLIPLATRALGGYAPFASRAAAIIRELMHGAGAVGMIGGQLLDLRAEEDRVGSLEALEVVHRAKTAALIAAAARIGGIAANASANRTAALGRYGADLGLAFQIVDDILDVTGSTADLGKTTGRDAALGKSTYPGLLGVNGAMLRARQLARTACDALAAESLLTPELRHIADIVITRTN